MLCLQDRLLVDLRQTIDVVVVAFDTEILRKVDDFHMAGDGMLLEELFALAVAETEEDHVDILERHLVRKPQVCIADESFVYITHQIAGIALRVGKYDLCLGMVQQQSDQLATRISCRT